MQYQEVTGGVCAPQGFAADAAVDPTTSLLDNPATHDRTVAFCEKMAPGFVYDKKMLQAFGGLPLEGMIRRNLVNLEPEEIKEFQAFLQRTPKADS